MLGLLIHRFETTRPCGKSGYESSRSSSESPRIPVPAGPRGPTPATTRNYFLRRAWRILHDRGRLGGPEYVRMAEQVLLQLQRRRRPAGLHRPRSGARLGQDGRQDDRSVRQLLRVQPHPLLEQPAVRPDPGRLLRLQGDVQAGRPGAAAARGGVPRALGPRPRGAPAAGDWSRSAPRSTSSPPGPCARNPEFCRGLGLASVKRLAASPFEPTARLGLELVVERFDPANPDPELVLILADSPLAEARRQAEGVGRGALGDAPPRRRAGRRARRQPAARDPRRRARPAPEDGPARRRGRAAGRPAGRPAARPGRGRGPPRRRHRRDDAPGLPPGPPPDRRAGDPRPAGPPAGDGPAPGRRHRPRSRRLRPAAAARHPPRPARLAPRPWSGASA